MLLAIKSLIGAAVVGVGALVPVAVKGAKSKGIDIKDFIPQQVVEAVQNSRTLKEVKKEVAVNKTNSNVSKAVQMLNDKGCKLMQNPQNPNNWFNSLYGCKNSKEGKSEFYYLGSKESLANEKDASLIKKVTSVDYQRGWDGVKAHLQLTLENNQDQKVDWAIYARSGWQNFKNVNLEESCKIETPLLGKDILRCGLKDSANNNEAFYYSFAIF